MTRNYESFGTGNRGTLTLGARPHRYIAVDDDRYSEACRLCGRNREDAIHDAIEGPVYVAHVTPGGTSYGATCYTAEAILYSVEHANPADSIRIRP